MQKRLSIGNTLAVGLIVVVVSVLVFFLMTRTREAIHWWGLAFILLAELLATAGIVGVDVVGRSPGVHRPALLAGSYSVLVIYAGLSVLCAVVFMWFMPRSVRGMVSVELALLALAAILMILLFSAARRIAPGAEAAVWAAGTMAALTGRAEALFRQAAGTPLAGELERLYEDLRFSDHSAVLPGDQALFTQLTHLEALLRNPAEEQAARDQIAALRALVGQRGDQVRQNKLGSV